MSIEAIVRTATCKSRGAYISITEARAYGNSIQEQIMASDMAKGIAEGHAKGHSSGLALEAIAEYKMLTHEERQKLIEGKY